MRLIYRGLGLACVGLFFGTLGLAWLEWNDSGRRIVWIGVAIVFALAARQAFRTANPPE